MSRSFLENTEIPQLKGSFSVMALQLKYATDKKRLGEVMDGSIKRKSDLRGVYADSLLQKDEMFDFSEVEIFSERDNINKEKRKVKSKIEQMNFEKDLLDRYGDEFAHLYQIKSNNDKYGDTAELSFREIEMSSVGILTQEQYFEMTANETENLRKLSLHVKLKDGEEFDLLMSPYDRPGVADKSLKMQLSLDDNDLASINSERFARIMEFCETHGFSTFNMDVPYSFDGSLDINEKLRVLLNEIKERDKKLASEKIKREIEINKQQEEILSREVGTADIGGVSRDLPNEQEIIHEEHSVNSVGNNRKPKKTIKDAEKGFEDFIEKGLGKAKGLSYFKEHTGILGSGWTEYIIYNREDAENRKKDAKRDKNGEVKYTYAFKLFMKQEKDGRFRFAYRTPDNKKIDDAVVNGMVGQFKSLGITHVRFPSGLLDAEKKLWRTALAENGIVPIGMGLDKAKAEGMLKAAKEKLSVEGLAKYKYKLALQMEKDNAAKGKKLDDSEQEFIDGLKNSHYYRAFTNAYGNRLKGMLRNKLDDADVNHDNGAVDKVAAYKAMRRLFDAFHETVHNGSILNSSVFSDAERRELSAMGLTCDARDLSEEQMVGLYEVMCKHDKVMAKRELDDALLSARDTKDRQALGPKRADNIIIKEVFDGARSRFEKINEMLKPLGVDEIDFPKSFGRLHYDDFYKEHPEFFRRTAAGKTQQQPKNSVNSDIIHSDNVSRVMNKVKNSGNIH